MSLLVLVVSVLFIFYKTYRFYANKSEKKIEPKQAQSLEKKQNIEKIPKEPEQIYRLQTHKMKYLLYDARSDLKSDLKYLYYEVIVNNFWINEPFHSKFYEILLMFDRNELMVVDKNTKVITMNIRDSNNKMIKSKAYQVFEAKNIVEVTIDEAMSDILRFEKQEAQTIVIAICIIVLEKSLHYLSREMPQWIIADLLKNYEHANDVKCILDLNDKKDHRLFFVQKAFQEAFQICETEPYNDSETSDPFYILKKLPPKYLREI